MTRRLALASMLACLAAGGVVAAPAGAYVTFQGGKAIGVLPVAGVTPSPALPSAGNGLTPRAANGNLDYHNGPVVHANTAFAIFWDPASGFTAANKDLINRYFTDVAHDTGQNTNVYAVGQQFTDTTGASAAYDSAYSGAVVDTQAYPTTANCSHGTTCLTKAQLEAELSRFVNANALPTGMGAIYFLFTPHAVTTCINATSSCSDDVYCAFHSSTGDGHGHTLLYAHDPFTLMDTTNAKGCQFDGNSAIQEPNGDIADVALKAVSHEHNETMTDPLGTAWWNSNTGNENGDQCNSTGNNANSFIPTLGGTAAAGTLFNQAIDANPYYLQSEWSNGDIACEMQPSAGTVTPAFTAPAAQPPGTVLSFDGTATTSTHTITSRIWDFGDGSAPAFGTSQTHTFAAAGSFAVRLTVTDDRGRSSSVTHAVVADHPPTADFAFAPDGAAAGTPVAFDGTPSGDVDGPVTFGWDFGDGATSAAAQPQHAYAAAGTYLVTLTVTDGLGLTATRQRSVTVAAAPPPPPSPPTGPSIVATSIPSTSTAVVAARATASLVPTSLGKIARQGLFAAYDVSTPGSIRFELLLAGATAKSLGIAGPAGSIAKKRAPVVVARGSATVARAGRGRVRLAITRAKLAKLRRHRSTTVTLRMAFTAAGGARIVASGTARLTR